MATISATLTLIDEMSSTLQGIEKNINGVKESLEGLGSGAQTVEKQANKGFGSEKFTKQCETFGKAATKAGKAITIGISAPLAALGVSAYNAATAQETALTGVRKTVDATEEEYARLDEQLHELSEIVTPTSYEELAGLAEIGGQLGVGNNGLDELYEFVRVMDMLNVSTNIQGEEGAMAMAKFLNLVDGSTANIARAAGVIVDLGNNFATTENDILSMATRMAATGNLVGMTVPEILALATVMSSLGIEAEAGGSAAGKLMKKMQLASEVGVPGWETLMSGAKSFFKQDFDSIHDLEMRIDALSKADLSEFAATMNMSTDELEDSIDAARDMEYFAEISGKTAAQFQADWNNNPAQAMLDFFAGLAALDESGLQSAVAVLNEMGLTEIRLANMIAAMGGNPEMLRDALVMAYAAYAMDPSQNAAWEEAQKFYNTTASQNAMLGNKWHNVQADFGENLVEFLSPLVEKASELLDVFNGLSEVDQERVIGLLGALVFTGPAVTAIGEVAKAVGSISSAVGNIKNAGGVTALLEKFLTFLDTPLGSVLGVTAAVAAISAAISSIPSTTEQVWANLQDIPVSLDEETYNNVMKRIQELRDATDELKGVEPNADYANMVSAVASGYGTDSMFGTALWYASGRANQEIDEAIASYQEQMREVEEGIARAGSDAEREQYLADYETQENAMRADVQQRQQAYTETLSDMFSGMVARYGSEADQAALAIMSDQYDLLATAYKVYNRGFDDEVDDQTFASWNRQMYADAFQLGYLDDAGIHYQSLDEVMAAFDSGTLSNDGSLATALYEQVAQDLESTVGTLRGSSVLNALMDAIFSDDAVMQSFDPTAATGALLAYMQALDIQNAMEQAGGDEFFADYLTLQFSTGIAQASEEANADAETLGANIASGAVQGVNNGSSQLASAVRNMVRAALAAGRQAADAHSPSRETMWLGEMMDAGLIAGIKKNQRGVVGAWEGVADSVANADVWDSISLFAGLEREKLLASEKDEIHVSDADIQRVRELAEREAINRFTTAQVSVEMHNTNEIKSNLDLDGIADYLGDRVQERLEAAAEGVYT